MLTGEADEEELQRALPASGSRAFKVPTRIVAMDAIPKGPTGKIQRRTLAERIGAAMRIAVVGAGAIGAYVGAALHRGGADVHLVARGANLAAIREHGVRVLSRARRLHGARAGDRRPG